MYFFYTEGALLQNKKMIFQAVIADLEYGLLKLMTPCVFWFITLFTVSESKLIKFY